MSEARDYSLEVIDEIEKTLTNESESSVPFLPATGGHPPHILFHRVVRTDGKRVTGVQGWGRAVGAMGIINVLPHAPAEVLVCPMGSFQAIELLFSTYGRKNDCVLQFELIDDGEWLHRRGWTFSLQKKERVLRAMEVHGSDVNDNTYFRFSFDRVEPPKPGKVYRLIVRSPDARPGHFVCVRGSVAPYDDMVLARAKACGDRHVGCEFNEDLIVATPQPQKVWLSAQLAYRTTLLDAEQVTCTIPDKQADALVLVPLTGSRLATTIDAPRGELVQWRISLELSSTVLRRSVAWELRRNEKSFLPLRAGSVHLADAVEDNMLSFSFDPLVCSEGEPLHLQLSFGPIEEPVKQARTARSFDEGLYLRGSTTAPDWQVQVLEHSLRTFSNQAKRAFNKAAATLVMPFKGRCRQGAFAETFGWNHRGYIRHFVPLLAGDCISQHFLCPHTHLFQLEFELTSFGKAKNPPLELFLYLDDEKEPVRQETLHLPQAQHGMVAWTFSPIAATQGRVVRFEVRSPAALQQHAVGVCLNEVPLHMLATSSAAKEPLAQNFSGREPLPESAWCSFGAVPQRALGSVPLSELQVVAVVSDTKKPTGVLPAVLAELEAAGVAVHVASEPTVQVYEKVLNAHLVFFDEALPVVGHFEVLARFCAHYGVPLVECASERPSREQAPRWGDFLLLEGANGANSRVRPLSLAALCRDITTLCADYEALRWPKVSIVSVLYGKERELPFFLRSIERQEYAGSIEVVMVDDCSPTDEAQLFSQWDSGRELIVSKLLVNQHNQGNCASRNTGVRAAEGDIILIVDADCLLSADLVAQHVRQYFLHGCDVVVGSHNLETGNLEPLAALARYETDRSTVVRERQLQDETNLTSYLNCITRNFSIRRSFISEPLFDTLFSYSMDPDSGFGWEDIEMGFRLYQRGADIMWAPDCFTVHVSHVASIPEASKPRRSLKNLQRLFEKHPEVPLISRRWATRTLHNLERWFESCGEVVPAVLSDMQRELAPGSSYLIKTEPQRKRILSYRWHAAHQYEIYKLPHDFTLLTFPDLPGFTTQWGYEQRPLHPNVRFCAPDDVRFEDYDMVIVHFDENALAAYNTNGVIPAEWGAPFRWCIENLALPTIAVCHGVPQFYGQYGAPVPAGRQPGDIIEFERSRLVDYLQDVFVVANSHQAFQEWGFHQGQVVWHGFDPAEYQLSTYEKGVLTLGKNMAERPLYRGYPLFQQLQARMSRSFEFSAPAVVEPSHRLFHQTNDYARARFRNYKNDIRRYSVYLNPTWRSPMPRSRAEAMLCGLVPVSAENHDVAEFIINGENGFYAESAEALAEALLYLDRNPWQTRKIGHKARETAQKVFHHDRFLAAWVGMVEKL